MKWIPALLLCCVLGPVARGQVITRWRLAPHFSDFGIQEENVPLGTPDQMLRYLQLELMLQGYHDAQIDTLTSGDTLRFSLEAGTPIDLPITSVRWNGILEHNFNTAKSPRQRTTLGDQIGRAHV